MKWWKHDSMFFTQALPRMFIVHDYTVAEPCLLLLSKDTLQVSANTDTGKVY